MGMFPVCQLSEKSAIRRSSNMSWMAVAMASMFLQVEVKYCAI